MNTRVGHAVSARRSNQIALAGVFMFQFSAIAKHLTVSRCMSYSDVSPCRIILKRGRRIVEQQAAVLLVLLSDSL
jgi:hypothetical protein